MRYAMIQSAYSDEYLKTPIGKKFIDWARENCPGETEDIQYERFRTQVWDQMDPAEKEELKRQQEESLNELKQNMISELSRGFGTSRMTAKFLADLPQKVYEKACRDNPGIDIPKPGKKMELVSSSAEREQRRQLSERARNLLIGAYSDRLTQIWREKTNDLEKNGDLSRDVSALCKEKDAEGRDLSQANETLLKTPMTVLPTVPKLPDHPTPAAKARRDAAQKEYDRLLPIRRAEEAQRRDLLDRQLKKAIALTRELRQPMTDEQFVEKYCNPESLNQLLFLGELQISNYDQIVAQFGVEPSADVKKDWELMAGSMVASTVYQQRLAYIANPLYADCKDIDGMARTVNYAVESEYDQIIEAASSFGVESDCWIQEHADLEEWRTNPAGSRHFNASHEIMMMADHGCGKDSLYQNIVSAVLPATLEERYGVKMDKLSFKDLRGNELDLRTVYDRLREGKTCNLYQKENGKLLETMKPGSMDPQWGSLRDPEVPANYRINTAHAEELENNIKALNGKINDATHWYMKSSPEFTLFRKAMEALGKPGAFDDRDRAKNRMRDVVNKARAYIMLKEADGVAISDRTQKRLDIAHEIASAFERTLTDQSQPVLPNVERENIVVEQAADNDDLTQHSVGRNDRVPVREGQKENSEEEIIRG